MKKEDGVNMKLEVSYIENDKEYRLSGKKAERFLKQLPFHDSVLQMLKIKNGKMLIENECYPYPIGLKSSEKIKKLILEDCILDSSSKAMNIIADSLFLKNATFLKALDVHIYYQNQLEIEFKESLPIIDYEIGTLHETSAKKHITIKGNGDHSYLKLKSGDTISFSSAKNIHVTDFCQMDEVRLENSDVFFDYFRENVKTVLKNSSLTLGDSRNLVMQNISLEHSKILFYNQKIHLPIGTLKGKEVPNVLEGADGILRFNQEEKKVYLLRLLAVLKGYEKRQKEAISYKTEAIMQEETAKVEKIIEELSIMLDDKEQQILDNLYHVPMKKLNK